MHPQHVFAAHRLRQTEGFRVIRIKYNLNQTLPVPKVDEDDAAMVAPPMDPAAQIDFLAQMAFRYFPTSVATHV
ncbi:hypothetical protein JCM19379_16560 [Methyloparacoccus murrellii]|jgi:hypothetical protein